MDGKTEMSRLARDDWFCKEDKRGRVHVLKTEKKNFLLNVPVTLHGMAGRGYQMSVFIV